ncbi:MAG: DUF3570 domain-containing protein [Gammaproteobacteria bacterium]|nr:DUF3570 domain-containing protein [Gammaproteobacteria bacterium]MCP4391006.1 DUF3570 domain-containing protein [Gammaproteobacteria bacterium]MCP4982173.1 DUF3570 domain-containing protein [Gammaproteobacteria bacterium]
MKCISRSLSCATCTLLGLSVAPAASAAQPWDIDLGLMNYVEQDRNTGLEFLFNARREFADGDKVTLGVEIDTLTGATPNGATASNVIQTFTQSSGDGSYHVEANELPADDTHMDTRLALNAGYKDQLTSDMAISYDGHISMEFDYLSFGAGNSYQWDINQRNTSLYVGFYGEYNRVHPVGNIPLPLSLMTPAGSLQNRRDAADTRSVAEVSVGATQIINRSSLIQLRFTQSRFSGYLNDPYKILSVVDDQNPANLGATIEYRFENRPQSRDLSTFYVAYKQDFDSGILDLSLRLSDDDWGVNATALDMRYRYRLRGKAYLQPHLRFYHQQEADFFRHSLVSSESLPLHVSADTRMAEFDAITIGLKYGFAASGPGAHSVTVEYYTQQGESSPDDAVGLQQQQDLFPTLKTLMIKYLFSTQWE